MSDDLTVTPGPYQVGEVPEPFDIYVTNDDRTPYDLTGFTVDGSWSVRRSTPAQLTVAVVDAEGGVVRVTPTADQFAQAGLLKATIWGTSGSLKPVLAKVVAPIETPGSAID